MDDFVESLQEIFALFGVIEVKRMFGGYGVYHDGLMFALVADNVLYLKADERTVGRFEELGLSHFEYIKSNRKIKISYYEAPAEIFDDPELAREWAIIAYDSALRSRR